MKLLKMMIATVAIMAMGACTRVGNGEVGVRYYTWGSEASRGVESKPLGMGWYFTAGAATVETFQTFTNTTVWNGDNGGTFTFSDKDGQSISADIAVTFSINGDKAPILFQKYRKGYDELQHIVIHNLVRDALNTEASKHPIEWLYGEGRSRILNDVTAVVRRELSQYGINIEKLAWVGAPQVPEGVKAAINLKTVAKQNAQRVENEVAQTRAEAEKARVKAQGEADAIILKAEAQAKANQLLTASITSTLVEYNKVNKWNGRVPNVTGNGGSIISLKDQ